MEISPVAARGGVLYRQSMSLLARQHLIARALSGRPAPLVGRLLRADPPAPAPADAAGDAPPAPPADTRPKFILATGGEASDGCILRMFWDLSRANGVGVPVLWGHDQGALLGQWRDVRLEEIDGQTVLTGRCDLDPELPEGVLRLGQIKRGYLKSVSVGWIPGEMIRRGDLPPNDPHYREPIEGDCGQAGEGYVMGSAERPNILVETSLVSTPADPGAAAIERLHGQGAAALARAASGAQLDGRDLDLMLASLASLPRVRGWLDAQIDRGVRAALTRLGISPSAPPPPAPAPGGRSLSDIFPAKENA